MSEQLDFVYLLKLHCSPPVYKIGMSYTPVSRAKQFVGWMPWRVTLEHKIRTDTAPLLELHLQERFRERYLQHEWFQLTDDDVALIVAVAECPTAADLPANLIPSGDDFLKRRGAKPARPLVYDREKYLSQPKPRDPWRFAITKNSDELVALGDRGRLMRFKTGKTQTDIGNVGRIVRYDDGRKDRISPSFVVSAEKGQAIITFGRLWLWAWGLGVTIREFIGDELLHLVPPEEAMHLDSPPLPRPQRKPQPAS